MNALQGHLDEDTVIVADASYSSVWVCTHLESLRAGQRFLTPRGLAGLGWGYPMALGAQAAAPNATVICVVGDGGFGHCWAELETAKRMGSKVFVIVLNNAILGYQKDAEELRFDRYTSAIHFEAVDHATIAEACGVTHYQVSSAIELREALSGTFVADSPVLIDVMTDPNAVPPVTMFDKPDMNE